MTRPPRNPCLAHTAWAYSVWRDGRLSGQTRRLYDGTPVRVLEVSNATRDRALVAAEMSGGTWYSWVTWSTALRERALFADG